MGPLRKLLFPLEALVYGPAYAGLQHLIRSPQPSTRILRGILLPAKNHWPTVLSVDTGLSGLSPGHYCMQK